MTRRTERNRSIRRVHGRLAASDGPPGARRGRADAHGMTGPLYCGPAPRWRCPDRSGFQPTPRRCCARPGWVCDLTDRQLKIREPERPGHEGRIAFKRAPGSVHQPAGWFTDPSSRLQSESHRGIRARRQTRHHVMSPRYTEDGSRHGTSSTETTSRASCSSSHLTDTKSPAGEHPNHRKGGASHLHLAWPYELMT